MQLKGHSGDTPRTHHAPPSLPVLLHRVLHHGSGHWLPGVDAACNGQRWHWKDTVGTHYAPHCLCCTRLCIMEGDSNSQKWTLNEFCPIPTGVGLTAPYNLCCAILESCGDCPPDSKSLVLRSAKKGRLREGGLRHTFQRLGVLNCRIF